MTTMPTSTDPGEAALAAGRVRRHALNTGFRWERHEGPFRRITAEQAQSYDDNGFFVLEDAFDADEMAMVIGELDPQEAGVEEFLSQLEDGKFFIARAGEITFTTHPVQKSDSLRAFVSGPVFQDLVADVIGPDVRLYWDQAVYKKPGTDAPFPWHQDNGYTFIEPQQYLTCWIALTDADERNGCPWIAPGAHRAGTLAHTYVEPLGYECFTDPPAPALAAPVRAGSALVFSSLTPHFTGPNLTEQVRKAYILQYAPAGARVLRGDPNAGPPLERVSCDDPKRQFPILRAGVRV